MRVRKGSLAAMLLVMLAPAVRGAEPAMKAPELGDIVPEGMLRQRAELSAQRLQHAYYQWPSISKVNFSPFPGDAIGRNILGLTLLARTCRQDAPANLQEIMKRLGELECPDGYLGPPLPAGRANEDVLAAHNGYLRGLCEYYLWTKDAATLRRIERVRDNLLVPARGAIAQYRAEGDARPTIKWHLSGGDIGQLFLVLDGATQAYAVAPSPEFKEMLDAMIGRYQRLELIKISAQTHAMLSAANGIVRWYERHGNPEHLKFAVTLYDQYRRLATTETFENYNWFNRPEWTEACAVVDSFLLTTNLWRLTGRTEYLEDAHHILYNALLPGQRANGGFGTNKCVGAKGQVMLTVGQSPEAPFCCSMRGAEGLARAVQFGYFVKQDKIVLAFFAASTATLRFADGECRIRQDTKYPHDGYVRLEVLESSVVSEKQFEFFVPSWAAPESVAFTVGGKAVAPGREGAFAQLALKPVPGSVIDYRFRQRAGAADLQFPERMPGHHCYHHGSLLLGRAAEKPVSLSRSAKLVVGNGARYRDADSEVELAPLLDLMAPPTPAKSVQMLFVEPPSTRNP